MTSLASFWRGLLPWARILIGFAGAVMAFRDCWRLHASTPFRYWRCTRRGAPLPVQANPPESIARPVLSIPRPIQPDARIRLRLVRSPALKVRSDPAGQSSAFIPRHRIPLHAPGGGSMGISLLSPSTLKANRGASAAKLAFSDRVDKARWRVVPSLLRRRCDPRNERGGLHPARTSELT